MTKVPGIRHSGCLHLVQERLRTAGLYGLSSLLRCGLLVVRISQVVYWRFLSCRNKAALAWRSNAATQESKENESDSDDEA